MTEPKEGLTVGTAGAPNDASCDVEGRAGNADVGVDVEAGLGNENAGGGPGATVGAGAGVDADMLLIPNRPECPKLPALGTRLGHRLFPALPLVPALVRPMNRLRELHEELVLGLTSGWLSKICTCRACFVFTESAVVRFGIWTLVRGAGFGGTPTLREVGGGEVQSWAWMCPSTSGMEITIAGESAARKRDCTRITH